MLKNDNGSNANSTEQQKKRNEPSYLNPTKSSINKESTKKNSTNVPNNDLKKPIINNKNKLQNPIKEEQKAQPENEPKSQLVVRGKKKTKLVNYVQNTVAHNSTLPSKPIEVKIEKMINIKTENPIDKKLFIRNSELFENLENLDGESSNEVQYSNKKEVEVTNAKPSIAQSAKMTIDERIKQQALKNEPTTNLYQNVAEQELNANHPHQESFISYTNHKQLAPVASQNIDLDKLKDDIALQQSKTRTYNDAVFNLVNQSQNSPLAYNVSNSDQESKDLFKPTENGDTHPDKAWENLLNTDEAWENLLNTDDNVDTDSAEALTTQKLLDKELEALKLKINDLELTAEEVIKKLDIHGQEITNIAAESKQQEILNTDVNNTNENSTKEIQGELDDYFEAKQGKLDDHSKEGQHKEQDAQQLIQSHIQKAPDLSEFMNKLTKYLELKRDALEEEVRREFDNDSQAEFNPDNYIEELDTSLNQSYTDNYTTNDKKKSQDDLYTIITHTDANDLLKNTQNNQSDSKKQSAWHSQAIANYYSERNNDLDNTINKSYSIISNAKKDELIKKQLDNINKLYASTLSKLQNTIKISNADEKDLEEESILSASTLSKLQNTIKISNADEKDLEEESILSDLLIPIPIPIPIPRLSNAPEKNINIITKEELDNYRKKWEEALQRSEKLRTILDNEDVAQRLNLIDQEFITESNIITTDTKNNINQDSPSITSNDIDDLYDELDALSAAQKEQMQQLVSPQQNIRYLYNTIGDQEESYNYFDKSQKDTYKKSQPINIEPWDKNYIKQIIKEVIKKPSQNIQLDAGGETESSLDIAMEDSSKKLIHEAYDILKELRTNKKINQAAINNITKNIKEKALINQYKELANRTAESITNNDVKGLHGISENIFDVFTDRPTNSGDALIEGNLYDELGDLADDVRIEGNLYDELNELENYRDSDQLIENQYDWETINIENNLDNKSYLANELFLKEYKKEVAELEKNPQTLLEDKQNVKLVSSINTTTIAANSKLGKKETITDIGASATSKAQEIFKDNQNLSGIDPTINQQFKEKTQQSSQSFNYSSSVISNSTADSSSYGESKGSATHVQNLDFFQDLKTNITTELDNSIKKIEEYSPEVNTHNQISRNNQQAEVVTLNVNALVQEIFVEILKTPQISSDLGRMTLAQQKAVQIQCFMIVDQLFKQAAGVGEDKIQALAIEDYKTPKSQLAIYPNAREFKLDAKSKKFLTNYSPIIISAFINTLQNNKLDTIVIDKFIDNFEQFVGNVKLSQKIKKSEVTPRELLPLEKEDTTQIQTKLQVENTKETQKIENFKEKTLESSQSLNYSSSVNSRKTGAFPDLKARESEFNDSSSVKASSSESFNQLKREINGQDNHQDDLGLIKLPKVKISKTKKKYKDDWDYKLFGHKKLLDSKNEDNKPLDSWSHIPNQNKEDELKTPQTGLYITKDNLLTNIKSAMNKAHPSKTTALTNLKVYVNEQKNTIIYLSEIVEVDCFKEAIKSRNPFRDKNTITRTEKLLFANNWEINEPVSSVTITEAETYIKNKGVFYRLFRGTKIHKDLEKLKQLGSSGNPTKDVANALIALLTKKSIKTNTMKTLLGIRIQSDKNNVRKPTLIV